MGGHTAVTDSPTNSWVWKGSTVFVLANGLDPITAFALLIDGSTGPAQKATAVFSHERAFNTGF
jgi:hypothetical protein